MMLRIKAICFLVLFSFSTFGNAFEVHYCKGEMTDIAFFGGAECICRGEVEVTKTHCHASESSCSHHNQSAQKKTSKPEKEIKEKDCCQTESVQLFDESDLLSSNSNVITAVVAFVHYNPEFFLQTEKPDHSTINYNEPDFWVDIPILIQSFLI